MERRSTNTRYLRENRAALSEGARSASDPLTCGIVMAGGEGNRLKSFIHLLRGDLLPKQFVSFIGSRSMLEHTIHRAEKLIPPQRVFTVIDQAHLQFPEVHRQLLARQGGKIVLQPENRDTAAGILLPLIHLYKRYPDSVVVLFPADHFVLEEDRLIHSVRLACRAVHQDPFRLLLLGIKPESPEPDYGYILPGRAVKAAIPGAFEISSFEEKPEITSAQLMIRRGALWNTLLMIFKAATLLERVMELKPTIHGQFMRIYRAADTPIESEVTRNVYRSLETVNFSTEILEPLAQRGPSGGLMGAPVSDVLWSDWGTESRVLDTLRRTGNETRLNGIRGAAHRQDAAAGDMAERDFFPTPATSARPRPDRSEARKGAKNRRNAIAQTKTLRI